MNDIITIIQVLLLLVVFIYASIRDIKTRRVDRRVWYIPIGAGIVSLLYNSYIATDIYSVLVPFTINLITISLLAFSLYYFRLYHAADYKAFISIAVLLPTNPDILSKLPLYNYPSVIDYTQLTTVSFEIFQTVFIFIMMESFAMTVMINAAVIAAVYPLWNIGMNIKNGSFAYTKPLLSLTAQKIPIADLQHRFGHVLTPSNSDNKLIAGYNVLTKGLHGLSAEFIRDYHSWYADSYNPTAEISDLKVSYLDEFLEESELYYSDDIKSDKEELQSIIEANSIWMTPGIPFILPMTISIVLSVVFGNLLFALMFFL